MSVAMAKAQDLNNPELLHRITQLRRTDNWTNWLYLIREYLFLGVVLGGVVWFYCWLWDNNHSLLWAILPTLAANWCVGAGQHRLATLTHEAAHYMLFKNRVLNEFVSEWFCMFPLLGATHSYRVQHLGHHQYPNNPDLDPDWAQMRLSGHRFQFPMTRGQFLWHCLFKQLLFPPYLIAYVLVRAFFKVDHGPGTPYHLKRRTAKGLIFFGAVYLVSLIGLLWWFAQANNQAALALIPAGMWLGAVVLYLLAPQRWFGEYAIKCDIPVRTHFLLRLTFFTLLLAGLAWLSALTGRPWGLFFFVLWVAPLGTSFSFFMIMRQIVQHGNADRDRLTNTRVFRVHPLINMSVFPIGNDDHLPHHLFPMVPHYNLRALHDLLMETEEYRNQAVIVEGYFFSPVQPPRHPTVVDIMTH
jgi:fatty acid desaturase